MCQKQTFRCLTNIRPHGSTTSAVIVCHSLVQKRKVFCRLTPRKRAQKGINVGRLFVRQDSRRVGWHVVRSVAQIGQERFDRHLHLCDRRCWIVHSATLSGAAVTCKTSVSEIDALSVGGIAGTCILRQRRRGKSEHRKRGHDERYCSEMSEPHCELSHGHLLS